jgi:hypothetical protein
VDSDHFPIQIEFQLTNSLNTNHNITNNSTKPQFNYNKANWINFASDLEKVQIEKTNSLTIEQLNEFIINEILKSCEKNIPKYNPNNKCKELPQYKLDLIKHRKFLKSQINKHKRDSIENLNIIKTEYHLIKKIINEELSALKDSKWIKFINKLGNNPTSSSPFWKRINFHKNKNKQNTIKTLVHNNQVFHTNVDKANLFANILAEIFDNKNETDVPKTLRRS